MFTNRTKWMLGAFAGAALLTSNAMAVLATPNGDVDLHFIDGTSFYGPGGEVIGRGVTPSAGDRDFTAFRVTVITDNNVDGFAPAGHVLTGVISYLHYRTGFTPIVPGSPPPLGLAILEDDTTRVHTTAGPGTAGRFFLFDNTTADAGQFTAGVSGPSNVVFSGTGGPDLLTNFTEGTLLATGSLTTDGTGGITQLFQLYPFAPDHGRDYNSTLIGGLVIDGGAWAPNIDDATYRFILDTINSGATLASIQGSTIDTDVFKAGWQGSSSDPIALHFTTVPEPVTAGLGFLALSGLAGYVTSRRKA